MKASVFLQCAIAAAACAATGIHAQSLRCNGDLAGVGDSRASVFQKCGQPMMADSFCKPQQMAIQQPNPYGTVTTVYVPMPCEQVEEWTYNPGSGQFLTTFRFENGIAVSLRYGDRVR